MTDLELDIWNEWLREKQGRSTSILPADAPMGWNTQFCRRKSLVFPNFKKSDIRIRKYDYGSHYYAFVGDMQVRDGDKLKWNTYEEAYLNAEKLVC